MAAAIDQVIDQQPRPGEQVQEVSDELIEDSPYQARQSLDETSLEELAQGMREVGIQGVLIVRPHADPAQRGMLGKSESWVKTRSRIHRLPDALKDRLRARPGAISQIVELGVFYEQQPLAALALADRVIQEQMTLTAVRATIRDYARPHSTANTDRDGLHNRDGAVPVVAEITNDAPLPYTPAERRTKVSETSLDHHKVPSIVESFYPALATQLCEHIEQVTVELRQMPGELSDLDDATTHRLMQAAETLLHELARLTQILEGT